MKRGHFKGKFIIVPRGCPVSPDTWFTIDCSQCIYYRADNPPEHRCLNFNVLIPRYLYVFYRLNINSYYIPCED